MRGEESQEGQLGKRLLWRDQAGGGGGKPGPGKERVRVLEGWEALGESQVLNKASPGFET